MKLVKGFWRLREQRRISHFWLFLPLHCCAAFFTVSLLFQLDMAWVAIILCGVPIILEAIIGLVTAFDIKADVLVSLALIASVAIGEIFAAGEVALSCSWAVSRRSSTVAKARAD